MTRRACVCVKVVPRGQLRLGAETFRLERLGPVELNPPDLNAVEAALRLREPLGLDEVVVISLAPPSGEEAIRRALAMGPERGILISDDAFAGSDLKVTSRALASVVNREAAVVTILGAEGTDSNGGMLAAAIAERLEVTGVSRVWELSGSGQTVVVKRQMEYGLDQLAAALPCVIALSGPINLPRYPSLRDVIASKRKPVEMLDAAAISLRPEDVGEAGAGTRVLSLSPPPSGRQATVYRDDDGAGAASLFAHLQEVGVVP